LFDHFVRLGSEADLAQSLRLRLLYLESGHPVGR
jgi:hypothetical protein